MENRIDTGRIVTTHGVKGEVRIETWADAPEKLLDCPGFYLADGRYLKTKTSRVHRGCLSVCFEGVDSIDAALPLVRQVVYIPREWIKLEKGQYLIRDLVGLTIVDGETEQVYGKLTDVLPTGANDVYVCRDGEGKETLIPAVPSFIKEVDLENRILRITPIEGLFDDEV